MAIEADYDEIFRLRGSLLNSATSLEDGRQALADLPALANGVFGDVDGASHCASAYRLLRLRAIDTVERLAGVIDADAAKMQRMYNTYVTTDQETADRIYSQAGNRIDVFSSHVHSGTGVDHDHTRAREIDALGDAVAANEGAAIVGGDLNADLDNRDNNEESSEAAIDRYESELGLENVGTLYDEYGNVAPTSNLGEGRAIDYVFSTPMEVGDAERVHGEPSDHDGQAVDVTIDRW